MATDSRSHPEGAPDPEPATEPEIAICESSPGRTVFLESGNSEGWISTDTTVEITR